MGLFRTCAGGASQYCVCSARPASERLPRCSPPRSILRRSLLPHCLWCWALAARPLWQRPCRQSATADRRESPPFFYLFFIFFPYGRGHVAKARPQIGGNRHLFICMYIYTCLLGHMGRTLTFLFLLFIFADIGHAAVDRSHGTHAHFFPDTQRNGTCVCASKPQAH